MRPKRRADHRGELYRIGDLTGRVLGRLVPAEALSLSRIQLCWRELLAEPAASHSWPAAVERDELVVHVADSQWIHEFAYLRADLLEQLGAALPAAGIARLRVRIGPLGDARA